MIKYLLSFSLAVWMHSCTSTVHSDKYSLETTDELISFPVMEEVRVPQHSVSLFKENGADYLSFQNMPKSEILIYSVESRNLVKRLCLNTEGNNAVPGGFGGYYIADMNHIKNPDYSDDMLRFRKLNLIKLKK